MPVTTNFDVRINDIPFSEQPSRLVPHPPKAKRFSPIKGGFISFNQDLGWTFDLEWGSEGVSDSDALADVASFWVDEDEVDLGANPAELSFVWYDGLTYTFTVIWNEAVIAALRWGTNVEKFKITLYEADFEL